jgi:hypothetical protein
MTTDAVRSLIREVLAEELGRIARERTTTPTSTQEVVSIRSNEDLQALVQHIVEISRDKTMRDRIVSGDHIFVLGSGANSSATGQVNTAASTPELNSSEVVQINEGFLSERRIEALPAGTRVVQLGQGVRFTPLARDRLRQRKIAVERIK